MRRRTVLLAGAAVLAAAGVAHAQSYRTLVESRQRTDERNLTVDLGFAAGHIEVTPAEGGSLYRLAMVYDEELFRPSVRFRESRNRLYADLESIHNRPHRDWDELDQRLSLAISPNVLLDLDLKFGAVSADLELGGLSLREGRIRTGASETTVRFSSPNRAVCESLQFEVGAAQFEALSLANARCRLIKLSGGVAEVLLDFTGEWSDAVETKVNIKMGLGEIRLLFPEDLGVRLHVDRFLVSVDRNGFDKGGSTYTSRNWDDVTTHIEIEIDAALGSVEVEWVPNR